MIYKIFWRYSKNTLNSVNTLQQRVAVQVQIFRSVGMIQIAHDQCVHGGQEFCVIVIIVLRKPDQRFWNQGFCKFVCLKGLGYSAGDALFGAEQWKIFLLCHSRSAGGLQVK